jgi:hypothetical protein
MADELTLTVVVKGVMSDKDESVPIKKATVLVENSNDSPERRTNTNGKATFNLEAGPVFILVTGQDTEEHWATGSCSVELDTDLIINFQLDLEKTTHECGLEKNPLASAGDSEADEGLPADADEGESADDDE